MVALTLSPVMSAHLLRPGTRNRGLPGLINRGFEPIKATYARHLDASFTARGAIYLAWVVVSVLALVMFRMSPKELAPAEDQGVIFGIVNTPSNSTLDQVTPSTRAVNETRHPIPEAGFTFQITFPNGGFWGVGLKPWDERKRSAFQILPEVQRGSRPSRASRPSASCRRRCPAAGSSRSSSSSPRPPSRGDPGLRAAAPAEGGPERHVRLPAAHRREDRPARSPRSCSTATRWPSSA